MTLQLIPAELVDAVVELRRVHALLGDARREAARDVDVLLDGGWSGRAATVFAGGWEEWRHGCDEVLDALDTMASLVEQARVTQTEVDGVVAATNRQLLGRLG